MRIFKSRTQATDACKTGKVKVNDVTAKPSQSVEVGDHLAVRKNGFHLQFKVLDLIKKRVGAPIAVTCYEDLTPEEEKNKYNDWFVGKGKIEKREKGAGRPTKKDRRRIDDFKDDWF